MRASLGAPVLAMLLLVGCTGLARPEAAPPAPTAPASSASARAKVPIVTSAAPAAPSVAASAAAIATPAPVEGKAWAAIVHPRRDVYELSLEQLKGVLAGRVRDWSELGGAAGAIEVFVPAGQSRELADALGLSGVDLRLRERPLNELIEAVRGERRAFALVPPEALTPDVLPLVVDGHDPLRDRASRSPLRIGVLAREFDPVMIASPGEILPVRCANAALEAHGDFNVMFEDVRPLLEQADIAIGGLDTPLTDVSPPTPCVSTFTLQGNPRAADAIAAAGIDLLFVNGNHMLDCWQPCAPASGLRDTLARLQRLGVATAGAGENEGEARAARIIEVQPAGASRPVRVAFLAYDEIAPWNWATASTPGTAALKQELVVEDVRRARANADLVVVGMSFGIEYQADPTSSQRALAAAAIEAGATLIVGNHPHVVEAIERRTASDAGVPREAFVIYAQGNYLFDQSWSVPTTQAAMLEAGFVDGRLIGYRLRPVVTRGNDDLRRGLYRPELVSPAGPEGRAILGRIWDAQDRLPR